MGELCAYSSPPAVPSQSRNPSRYPPPLCMCRIDIRRRQRFSCGMSRQENLEGATPGGKATTDTVLAEVENKTLWTLSRKELQRRQDDLHTGHVGSNPAYHMRLQMALDVLARQIAHQREKEQHRRAMRVAWGTLIIALAGTICAAIAIFR